MKNSTENQSSKWLVIFLIYADFTTNEQLAMIDRMKIMVNSMLSDLITTPIDNNLIRIFVAMNSIKYVLSDSVNQTDDITAFFTIKNRKTGVQNYISNCELIDNSGHYKEVNGAQVLQKAEQLAAVLKKTAVQPDEQIFLITWDHGSAFGIFRQEDQILNPNVVRTEIDENLSQYPFIKLFWDKMREKDKNGILKNKPAENAYTTIQLGHDLLKIKNSPENQDKLKHFLKKKCPFVYDEKAGRIRFPDTGSAVQQQTAGDQAAAILSNEIPVEPKAAVILTNSDLNACLENWLGNRKVDVLMMSNCWMMNLHTMYALRNTVKCLVAPQGSIDLPGYNLKDILLIICGYSPTGLKAEDLAINCVETIDNTYSQAKAVMLDRDEPGILNLFKIFAVDLSKTTNGKSTLETHIELLGGVIDLLVKQLSLPHAGQVEMKYFLKYVRSVCFDFTEGIVMMVDVINWLRSINFANEQFNGLLQKLPRVVINSITALENSVKNDALVLSSSHGKKIYSPQKADADFAVIALPPTGYSFFFPIEDCNTGMSASAYANVRSNVLSDELLRKLNGWRTLLNFIDPQIDNVFVNAATP